MKYLLTFNIEHWGGQPWRVERQKLVLKVEFIEESVKKDGFFQLGLYKPHNIASRLIFHFKSCEVIEGPKEVRNPNNDELWSLLWRNDCQDDVVIALQVHNACTGVDLMGFEPIPDEEHLISKESIKEFRSYGIWIYPNQEETSMCVYAFNEDAAYIFAEKVVDKILEENPNLELVQPIEFKWMVNWFKGIVRFNKKTPRKVILTYL